MKITKANTWKVLRKGLLFHQHTLDTYTLCSSNSLGQVLYSESVLINYTIQYKYVFSNMHFLMHTHTMKNTN